VRTVFSVVLAASALIVPAVAATNAKASTLQMSADSSVTGWYPNEPSLSPANVTGGDFGEIFDTQLDGAVYAQPLVDQPTVLTVTGNDYAYGLNSTTGAIEWQHSYGTPADPLTNNGCGDIGNDLGITGTPVIDPSTGIAYFVAAEEVDGVAADFMEAVDVQTGATPQGWPTGGVPMVGSADNDSGTVFNGDYQTQRPGLILVNGVVYAAFGSQCDYDNWEGWLVGVSESSASITTMWSTEEDVSDTGFEQPGGGIWESGSAPVVDNGDIFFATGNGDIPTGPEPGTDTSNTTYGEAVVELGTNGSGQLQVVDWFMAADAQSLNNQDGDLGSGGPVTLPASMGTTDDPDPMVEDGKQGILYVLNMADLGGYQQGPSDGDDVEYETPQSDGSVWGKAGVWPGDGGYIYYQTSGATPLSTTGGALNVFQRVDTDGALSFQLVGSTANSDNTFGYGSGSPIVTSDGTASGTALLWIIHANSSTGTDSQLEAFDPVPENPGSDGTLEQVWSSAPFTSTVFSQPSVDNGILYVGTKDDTLLGFGAVPSSTPAIAGSDLSFDPTIVAQSTTLTETFTASAPTTVSSFVVSGACSIGTPDLSLPASLSTGESITVPVTFTPDAYGTNDGTLTANITGDTDTVDLSGVGDTASPSISISPDEVTFPPQPIGATDVTPIPVAITNTSTNAITVSAVTGPAAPFSLSDVPSLPLTLQPSGDAGDSFTFDVNFAAPGSSGDFDHDFNSVATIATTIGGSLENFGVAISGSADPPAQITTIPAILNFGDVAIGSSATMNFDLGDQGGIQLEITQSTPPTTNGFSALTNPFTQLADTTPPDTIAPNSSIQETVQFAPTSDGAVSATWLLEGNDGNGVQTVTLNGTGYTPAPPPPPPPSPPPPPVTTTSTGSPPPPTTTTTIAPTLTVSTRSGHTGVPLALKTSGDPSGGPVSFRVRDGTATGCAVSGDVLRASSSGTCVVIATKAASGETPSVTSSPTDVSFKGKSPRDLSSSLTISFAAKSSSLSAAAKIALAGFAKKLHSGESVTVTGYALREQSLANSRATAVDHFLSSRLSLHISVKTVLNISSNEATITS
jgi:hypothetical protein